VGFESGREVLGYAYVGFCREAGASEDVNVVHADVA